MASPPHQPHGKEIELRDKDELEQNLTNNEKEISTEELETRCSQEAIFNDHYGIIVESFKKQSRAYPVSPETLEDLISEASFKHWNRLSHIEKIRKPKHYFSKVAKHSLLKASKELQNSRLVPLQQYNDGQIHEPTAPIGSVAEELRIRIKWMLRSLPEIDQQIIDLFLSELYTAKEIAEIVGCSAASVRQRKHRALKKLKKKCVEIGLAIDLKF